VSKITFPRQLRMQDLLNQLWDGPKTHKELLELKSYTSDYKLWSDYMLLEKEGILKVDIRGNHDSSNIISIKGEHLLEHYLKTELT